ncbi:hypothetical protein NQZ68_021031 [Dissostichus eleginoides]|nr:hypothetical protein NQZ68_021031 [Dissostichus eleginoides]
MGRCQGAKSLRGLTGTESKQAQMLPADNLASPSTHRRKNIQKHGPTAPAFCNPNSHLALGIRLVSLTSSPSTIICQSIFLPETAPGLTTTSQAVKADKDA